ncbi:PP2C family protein-serine/threonine phosphatase [Microbacterium sp. GXF7504]
MSARVVVAAGMRTERGRTHEVNEDAVIAAHPVYLVSDGMGGHEAGDRASAAVVDAFAPLRGRLDVRPEEVVSALAEAHDAVARIARRHTRGAGATLSGVVAVVQHGVPVWLVVNLGDSRVYRLVGSALEQLTVDHSVVQELVASGALRPAEAHRHPERNVLTRAVGDLAGDADYWLAPIVTGERLLVCTDGLSDRLGEEAIRAGLTMGGAAAQTAHGLVAQALARGARDDVTAIVVDVREGTVTPRADDVTGGFGTSTQGGAEPVDADTLTGRDDD